MTIAVSMTPDEVRAARGRLGVSLTGCGALLGVHRLTVAAWEAGRREPPAYLRLAFERLEAKVARNKKER